MFLALLAVIGLALGRVRNLAVLDRLLDRLEDRSAQLRVRAALTLALAFAVLADRFGFASILGAFAAGLLVRTIDLTGRAPHPQFQVKLEGIGFGFLIPVFFITTGVQFDVRALVSNPAALAEVPLFLAALLVVRAVPALLYARRFGQRRARGGWPDAGHDADLRDRGDPDRYRRRADQPGHRRVAARRRAAVRRALPGRRAQAALGRSAGGRGSCRPARRESGRSGGNHGPFGQKECQLSRTGRGATARAGACGAGSSGGSGTPPAGGGR